VDAVQAGKTDLPWVRSYLVSSHFSALPKKSSDLSPSGGVPQPADHLELAGTSRGDRRPGASSDLPADPGGPGPLRTARPTPLAACGPRRPAPHGAPP
jgi:hypothetical protein